MRYEYSSVYTNIYQSYLGSGTDKEVQIENNCTRALVNTLLHADPQLTINFITFCSGNQFYLNSDEPSMDYLLQPSLNEDIKSCEEGLVLGITDKLSENEIVNQEMEGKADAAIIVNNRVMLVETKMPGNVLYTDQLERHKRTYLKSSSQSILDNSIKDWSEILLFFQGQMKIFDKERYPITKFLLEQFEEFCHINGLGVVDEDYYIRLMPNKAQRITREVIEYIRVKYSDNLTELNDVKGGIAFQRKSSSGYFAKIDSVNRKCLILYLSKSNQSKGLEYQEKLNNLGIGNRRSLGDDRKYPHEAYINLAKIKNIEEITQYIDDAYKLRP